MLRYQYASRSYYNSAEKLNDLVWLIVVFAWSVIFWHDNLSFSKIFSVGICFFADMVAMILNSQIKKNVYWASALRKYFDAYVLGINIDQFKESEIEKLEELSIKATKKCVEKSKEQMSNTCYDTPPGVHNWYEFSQTLSEQDAIYECQKQNCWWNKKLMYKRILYTIIVLLLLFIVYLVFYLFIKAKTGILLFFFSSSGLVLKCVERSIANCKYYMLSLKIDGALEVLTNSRSDENIKNLQTQIDARRSMLVLERNFIHKHYAKEYTELFDDIRKVKKIKRAK